MSSSSRLLSRRKAAEYLGVSLHVFDAMVSDGELTTVRLSRLKVKKLYDRQELDKLIEGSKSKPAGMPKTMPGKARNFAEFVNSLRDEQATNQ